MILFICDAVRKSLIDLINKTTVYKYDLTNNGAGILSAIYSTENLTYSAK